MTPTEHIAFHQLALDYWTEREQGKTLDVQKKHESLGWVDYQFSNDFLPFDPRWQWRRKPREPRRLTLYKYQNGNSSYEWTSYIAEWQTPVETLEVVEVLKEET